MQRVSCLILVVMLAALCACQPTPENEAVVNKRDGVYEQKIEIAKKEERQTPDTGEDVKNSESTSVPSPTEVPVYEFEPHWTDTVSLKNFDIDIDVDVEAPTTAIFPVYRVKSTPFAVEDARLDTICKVLIGEAAFARPGGATVQDLKEQLEQLQLGEYDAETQTWHPYDKETYDALAKDIMEEMETAPDEEDFSSSAVQIESLPAQLTYKAADGTLWELYYQEDTLTLSRNIRCIEQPERWVIDGDAISGEAKGTTLQNVSCTEEEARQSVQAFFEEANIGSMDISNIEKGRAVDMDTLEITKEGWLVECARKGGNCAAVNYKWNASSGTLRFSDESYSAGLKAESIVLFVDDKGVATITWSNPLEVLQTEVDNIEILPFDQMQGLIRQAIINGLSWMERKDSDRKMGNFHVTRVALSYCFAPVKDAPEEFYFTPTWFVFLRMNEASSSVRDRAIAINAVDGTRIDLSSVS